MNKTGAYHYTFESAGTHTIELHEKPTIILVKNMTDDTIKVSWGDSIDDNDYVEMLKETAEQIPYFAISSADLSVTIQAVGTGNVEVRILDY
jgi:hypothetical protein